MPSDPAGKDSTSQTDAQITGRCYCGATTVSAKELPQLVCYCHCSDCRRVTGAPVAAFAAFASSNVEFAPSTGKHMSINPGVSRWCCETCNSALAARFDYLPGMIYVPLGLLDQADTLPPQLHSHADQCLPWLRIDDIAERQTGSARVALNAKSIPDDADGPCGKQ